MVAPLDPSSLRSFALSSSSSSSHSLRSFALSSTTDAEDEISFVRTPLSLPDFTREDLRIDCLKLSEASSRRGRDARPERGAPLCLKRPRHPWARLLTSVAQSNPARARARAPARQPVWGLHSTERTGFPYRVPPVCSTHLRTKLKTRRPAPASARARLARRSRSRVRVGLTSPPPPNVPHSQALARSTGIEPRTVSSRNRRLLDAFIPASRIIDH